MAKINPSLIQQIKDKAVELGVDPAILLSIGYKESRIRSGLTGDKHLKNKAHGIFQVRKPALDDVNRYYKTSFTVDDMKNSIDANITAGALYYKMQADAYGAENTQQQLAMYNGGPSAKDGGNKGAQEYANSVQSYSSKIADIVSEPQPVAVTPSKNVPLRSPRPKMRPSSVATVPDTSPSPRLRPDELVPDVDVGDAYDDDFRTKDDLNPAPLRPKKKLTYIELAKMNKIKDVNKIGVGQKLKMPDGSSYTIKSGDTLSGIAKLHNRAVTESNDADSELWNDIFRLSEATSSPGRVKRAGASCSGSVTELRALAKKHSGTEKGKMYHWCANMKAGKKKGKSRPVSEGAEITMWTNPEYQGADVDDKYYEKQPVKIVDVSKLTPFEPADKMNPKDNHDNMMKFVDKIIAGKKIKPIVIVPYKGKGIIVDGHHRYFAHIKAGVDKIRAVIADPKDLTWRDDVPVEEQESIRESYEIEFVCVNPNFCDATEQKNQDRLFQALRAVPGIIVYKQDFDEHNSMAAIVKDEADTDAPKLIQKIAQQHKVAIDLENDVSQSMMDDIITGRLEGLTDYYDTDSLSEAKVEEGYKLRLERDKHIDVLHIVDTKTKKRIEVRGKKDYETNYDASDKLHQVLDKVGKAANISELMNGEVVGINPKHPKGADAEKTAKDILATESLDKTDDVLQYSMLEAKLDAVGQTSEIYVDMDGVLADFFGEWKKLIGSDWRKVKDIEPALQKIRDTEDFWLDLPLLPQAKNLLGMIKDLKGSYTILSSPLPDDPNSEPHKREWIDKHLSFFPPEKVIITHNKTPYATNSDGSPNILIDDFGQNVSKWEAAGGVGFKHKDHKFERTAKAIQQHMSDPAK